MAGRGAYDGVGAELLTVVRGRSVAFAAAWSLGALRRAFGAGGLVRQVIHGVGVVIVQAAGAETPGQRLHVLRLRVVSATSPARGAGGTQLLKSPCRHKVAGLRGSVSNMGGRRRGNLLAT